MGDVDAKDQDGFERARRGTVYWTLSLYIDADRTSRAIGRPGVRITPEQFAEVQHKHPPSVALRDAVDPLFNDIADREVQGAVQEHLLAAGNCGLDEDAAACARSAEWLDFRLASPLEWETEGLKFQASPEGLDKERAVRFRRFWFAHPNGALSYHLSFTHHYGSPDGPGYTPATYYFLSLLQKLAAPKEFKLAAPLKSATVFDKDLGIAPLDGMMVKAGNSPEQRFWPFVRERLLADAKNLFARILMHLEQPEMDAAAQADACANYAAKVSALNPDLATALIDLVPFIEVPGLKVPKSRFMFMIDDDRFFNHLLPLDPLTNETIARKLMVADQCYKPYEKRLGELVDNSDDNVVRLDKKFWDWVTNRGEYAKLIAGTDPKLRPAGGGRFANMDECARAIWAGEAETTVDAALKPLPAPMRLQIPAFKPNRTDCLDYLFLAGFNQNIIDFMNQDTSEILDSIDPLYPDSDDQAGERFFARYANHRAMLTYVPRSRSLETGNDYIGTCPYAFLIHVMSLHNEFLARDHERKSMTRIDRIEYLVAKAQGRTPPPLSAAVQELHESESEPHLNAFDQAESAINQLKLSNYKDYERFRYSNPFRYDTESVVFEKLRELRGTARKQAALAEATNSLEDHARDLHQRHTSETDKATANRDRLFNVLIGITGIFGAGQMFYAIGERAAGDPDGAPPTLPEPIMLDLPGMPRAGLSGEWIMNATEVIMVFVAALFFALLIRIGLRYLWSRLKR